MEETEYTYKGLVQKIGIPGLHKAVIRLLNPFLTPGMKILDCGAGSGAFALRLKDIGCYVEVIELYRDSFSPKDINCYGVNLNSDFSESISNKFDIITSIEVIEHLENPRHFLRECYKLLNPDGKLLITTPIIESIPGRLRFLLKGNFRFFDDDPLMNEPTHITPIQSYMFNKAISDTGFSIVTHKVYPEKSFMNSRKVVSFLSKFIAPFLQGIRWGDRHIFLLEKNSNNGI